MDGDSVCVAIGDDGEGIPEENKKLIFEPFFTTKPTGQGTGLGLDIVRHIVVDKFGGEIEIRLRPRQNRIHHQASRRFVNPNLIKKMLQPSRQSCVLSGSRRGER